MYPRRKMLVKIEVSSRKKESAPDMTTPLLLLEYFPPLAPDYSYGVLPDHLKHISLPIDAISKMEGCQWSDNGIRCGKKWFRSYIYYCEAHKDIPDIKRYEPITSCRKRK